MDPRLYKALAQRPGRSFLPGQEAHPPAIGAEQTEWDTVLDPERQAMYQAAAASVGLKFGPPFGLRPQQYPETTTVSFTTATHDGIPVALNADVPSQVLTWQFDDYAFITRVTYEVTALRLDEDGQPEPNFFIELDPGDYVYVDLQRDNGDKYTIRPITLAQMAGSGEHPYLFGLVPVVRRGTRVQATVSIMPPWSPTPATPPFVERIGMVQVTFHLERFEPWR